MKFHLYEKSVLKSKFLKEVSIKLNLNTKIFNKDIFQERNLKTDVIVARAFKPLPVILDLVKDNFESYKKIILFLGRSGKDILKDCMKKWKFEYKEKKSLTNDESFLIKINSIEKHG